MISAASVLLYMLHICVLSVYIYLYIICICVSSSIFWWCLVLSMRIYDWGGGVGNGQASEKSSSNYERSSRFLRIITLKTRYVIILFLLLLCSSYIHGIYETRELVQYIDNIDSEMYTIAFQPTNLCRCVSDFNKLLFFLNWRYVYPLS